MKKPQDKDYSYDGSVLLRARKRLKKDREFIAKKLTLNVTQIKSIEENLNYGFATPYFLKLSIERYAKILNVSIHKVLSYPVNEPITPDSDEPTLPKFLINFSNQASNLIILILVILSIALFFYYSKLQNNIIKNKEIIINEENSTSVDVESYPIIASTPEDIINADNLISDSIIDTPSQSINNTALNFICTIQSSPVTSFITKTPDKPSSYFHLVSSADQSICTIDSDGDLKTYNLIAGEKITHHGKPPFKIQLDPTASTLYFQGWIVYLNASNQFIQLDPALPPLID
ncbi:MAG: hypothetical protein P8K73_00445 [Methylophilaceae bacterium]|nr:hypothetical protein [Methylophilaceae bacterium]